MSSGKRSRNRPKNIEQISRYPDENRQIIMELPVSRMKNRAKMNLKIKSFQSV